MNCDICGCKETYIKDYKHTYTIKGQKINLKSKRRFCSNCNNLVYDEVLDNETTKKVIELYNESFGIDVDKLKEIRKEFGLSLELFSRIIGCAKKTLISYEKGDSIPNDCYAIIIKSLIDKPEIINTLISVNKCEFNNKEYNIIKSKIDNYFYKNNKKNKELTEYNGFSNYSIDKINNIILYFADKGILKTKLLKEMFYADFLYFKNNCKSITGLEYAKLPFGPVPDQFEELLNDCIKNSLINYRVEYDNQYEKHNIESIKEFDSSIFNEEELSILKTIKNKFNNYTSKDIVEYSHKEKAFTQTQYGELISYEYAFDIESL